MPGVIRPPSLRVPAPVEHQRSRDVIRNHRLGPAPLACRDLEISPAFFIRSLNRSVQTGDRTDRNAGGRHGLRRSVCPRIARATPKHQAARRVASQQVRQTVPVPIQPARRGQCFGGQPSAAGLRDARRHIVPHAAALQDRHHARIAVQQQLRHAVAFQIDARHARHQKRVRQFVSALQQRPRRAADR